ncbi:MAG: hypothetical protein LBR10_14595 [Prevotellaceae bacterium]|nr:hypothetical protein [Prevotellaceae bacterium]
MKIQQLYDLQQDINRLIIAGSKFAKDDPRLQKQIQVFNKLGEKAPVFKKIAEGIENLVGADITDSADKLSDISVLLYSVLYTQGETVEDSTNAEGSTKLEPILPLDDIRTDKSYMTLKPVIEALSTRRSGRLEVLKNAFENNLLNDFRIYHLLDIALEDKYNDLADYVETVIIPSIGKPMLPVLLKNFNYKDTVGDVRRFRLLNELNYPKIRETIEEIFAGKSKRLQTEAITVMSKNPEKEDLLIKFSSNRRKPVHTAARQSSEDLDTANAQQNTV